MNCSFAERNRHYPCGPSPIQSHETNIVPVLSCQRDLKTYLSSLGLSSVPQISEHELILNRAGLFGTDPQTKNTLTICPMHRYIMTVKWDGARHSRCVYPTHQARSRKSQILRRINMTISTEIYNIHNALVPIGSSELLFCICMS